MPFIEYKDLKGELNEVEEKFKQAQEKVEILEKEKIEALEEKDNNEAQIEALQEKIKSMKEKEEQTLKELNKLKEQVDKNASDSKGSAESTENNINKELDELLQEKGQLSDRLNETLDEYNAMATKNEELTSSLQSLQKEKDNIKQDAEENLMHIKGTLITFLQHTPYTDQANEAILSVVYSMLNFEQSEIQQIEATRKNNFAMLDKKNANKGGIFGMFGKKK